MSILGIRLGATNTSAAVSSARDLTVKAITFDGEPVLPTVVGHDRGRWLVGRDAKALMFRPGASVCSDFLRFLDRPVEIGGYRLSPAELAAMVVREVRRHAEAQIGETIHRCVLSAPAYFGVQERQVLAQAAAYGGLELLATLSEPVCAIGGAGVSETARSAVVVRMGGRGLDVAIACRRSPWQVLLTDGDPHLGGVELDSVLADWYLGHLSSSERDEFRADPFAQRRLLEEAERAKRMLTTHDRATFAPFFLGDNRIAGRQEIARTEFEHLATGIAYRVGAVVERTIEQARDRGMSPDVIDSFVFYGGSASVPFLRRSLEERRGYRFSVPTTSATLSARGAALIAAQLFPAHEEEAHEDACESPMMLCLVAPKPITIRLSDGQQIVVIERGTKLPVSVELGARVVEQTGEVRIPIYSGEELLGDFVARLSAIPRLGAEAVLEFQMDTDQHVACNISLLDAGVSVAADLVPSGASSREQVPAGMLERVHFTITAPPVMPPGRTYELDFWAHLESQRREVVQRAKEQSAGSELKIRTTGPTKVSRGTVLSVRLDIGDLTVDPPSASVVWEGEVGNVGFLVTVPAGVPFGTRVGTAGIHIAGLKVATLRFVVDVQEKPSERARLAVSEERIRRAFASYASSDRDAVLARVQGIQKGAPGIDVFVDVARLKPGEKWPEVLRKEILDRDVLYLFWSKAASRSEWVDREWHYALEQHGINFIDPVPLVSPEVVPPPPELACELHFNDWILAYMRNKDVAC